MEPKIIFEDSHLLVLDKPAGFIVNEAETTTDQPVIQTWLKDNFSYSIVKSLPFRSGIVHRLDKATSGLLLVAKDEKTFGLLQTAFKARQVQKTYLALVHGWLVDKSGQIALPVGRLPWRRDRFGVLPGGRDAITKYTVLNRYQNEQGDYSLLAVKPETGRTHQIRIHLKHIGHSLVADTFYAGRKTARSDQKWCPRLFLHASQLQLKHPITGKTLVFSSPLANDLQVALGSLTLDQN